MTKTTVISIPCHAGAMACHDCSVSLHGNPHFVRLLIDPLAWSHFTRDDGKHVAGTISGIALQHKEWLDPPGNDKVVCV